MSASFSSRALWPYAPLRAVFSILAIFSATALYMAFPRFAETPWFFSIAASILFVGEVALLEEGIRRIENKNARSTQAVRFDYLNVPLIDELPLYSLASRNDSIQSIQA